MVLCCLLTVVLFSNMVWASIRLETCLNATFFRGNNNFSQLFAFSIYTLQAYLIFVIFSPRAQFLAQFFSTQKRVNRDKTDFATKQRKWQKSYKITHMTDVEKSEISFIISDLRCFVTKLFCRDLRVVVWRKFEPKIVPVEKK